MSWKCSNERDMRINLKTRCVGQSLLVNGRMGYLKTELISGRVICC